MIAKLDALRVLVEGLSDHKLVICNGMIGREIYSLGDAPSRFYMIGSMGIAAPIALGLAHSAPHQKIAVFEGDGNTLMGLGNLAQIGALRPKNLLHICVDNGAHASTGGQKTLSDRVELEKIALASGYQKVWRADTLETLKSALQEATTTQGPTFLLVKVTPGTLAGVPRVEVSPPEIASRFRDSVLQG